MRVVTWNVNSIKARLDRVQAWLEKNQPDVVCIQELKVTEDKFPRAELLELGYHAAVCAEKTYNGVAILSKSEPENVREGLGDGVHDPEARMVRAHIDGVEVISVYVPNGQQVGSEQYRYKLKWIARMQDMLEREYSPDHPLLICGDFNVAIDERDVSKPEGWAQSVLFHPEVRLAIHACIDWGLYDTFRKHHPEGGVWSWWDYRGPMWKRDEGLKIDYIFATQPLFERCTESFIDKDERTPVKEGTKPSDHAPVVAIIS